MANRLKELFNPTPEQRKKQLEQIQKMIDESYEEKWCCTCVNYIPIDHTLPGFVTEYPTCKVMNGIANETCLFYESDGKGGILL